MTTYPPPGRELDATVAERVMGAEWLDCDLPALRALDTLPPEGP